MLQIVSVNPPPCWGRMVQKCFSVKPEPGELVLASFDQDVKPGQTMDEGLAHRVVPVRDPKHYERAVRTGPSLVLCQHVLQI